MSTIAQRVQQRQRVIYQHLTNQDLLCAKEHNRVSNEYELKELLFKQEQQYIYRKGNKR